MKRGTAHLRGNAVAYLALFVALGGTSYAATQITGRQVVDGTIRSADIRDGDIRARDIHPGSLTTSLFAKGQPPAGAGGPAGPPGSPGAKGAPGDQGPVGPAGPTFGDAKRVPNKNGIACSTENVVGEQTISTTRPSRILAFANGTLSDGGAPTAEYGIWLRLRNAADTATLAISPAAWDYDSGAPAADAYMPMSVTGVMRSGTAPEDPGPVLVVAPGTYRLQFIAWAGSAATACAAVLPDFGFNQGGGMGYVTLGNG